MKITVCFLLFSLSSFLNFPAFGQNGKELAVNIWPKGVAIPYLVSKQYGISGAQIIKGALLQIMKFTCIRFIPRTNNEEDYIVFAEYKDMSQETGTCWAGKWNHNGSAIKGNQKGRHIVSLWRNLGCFNRYNIINSVFQILGFVPNISIEDDEYGDIYDTLLSEHNLAKIQALYDCSSIDIEKIKLPASKEAEECRDENPNCVWWAEEGECSRNPDYMLHNCKASCKQCRNSITDDTVLGKIEPEECEDKNPNCGWWAKAGECIKNPNYMLHICKASCKKCLKDFFPIECPVWAATDQCKISPWVVENCGFSCKQFSKDAQTNTKMIPSEVGRNLTNLFFNSHPVNPNCTKEAKSGTCNSDPSYMKAICENSYCEKVNSCSNVEKYNCPFLAYKGECERNPARMQERCKGSCNKECVCEDDFPECPIWAAKGHCQLKPKESLFFCKRSCKNCEFCKDRNPECPKLASIGNCTADQDYMILNCAKSYKLCYSSD